MLKRGTIADLALLLVAVVWGSNFVIMKDALDHITPFAYLGIRFTLSFLIMVVIFWERVKKINVQDIIAGSIIGFFLFAGFATQTIGLLYTTPGKSGFITGINVIIVPFLYYMVTKKFPGWWPLVGGIFAVIGLGFLSLNESFTINIGDLLTLMCAFLFAGHIVSIGVFAPQRDPIILTIIQLGFTGIVNNLIALMWEPLPVGISPGIWAAILYAVVFCTIGAFVIQNVAQRYTPSTHAALILCLEAVFAVIFSYLFWGEELTVRMVIGCVFIFAGVIVTELKPGLPMLGRPRVKEKRGKILPRETE